MSVQSIAESDLEQRRAHLRDMWAAVAPAWEQHADYVDARGAGVTRCLLELAAPRPRERVLELACGAGGVGLAAAALVGPAGEVVLSDVVPEMTAIAAARATALGLGNVRALPLDLERIEQPDGAFDVVLCREGLMFAADPATAAREIGRVLAPGGRVAIAVWGPRERNPWLGLVFEAVSAELGRPLPPPGMPGPFSLGDDGRLAALLTGAGLTDVTVGELAVPLTASSFDEWWDRTAALAGPLTKVLAALLPPTAQALRARLREAVEPYRSATGIELPGVSLVASARAPG